MTHRRRHLLWCLVVVLWVLSPPTAAAEDVDADESLRLLSSAAQAHTAADSEFTTALYTACLHDPVCRSVHDQEHGEISITYFERITRALLPEIHRAATENAALAIARLIIHNTYLAEERCPPNSFWHYDTESDSTHCKCYFDRDCDIFAAGVCEDTTHNVLLVTTGILVLFVAGITLLFCVDVPPLPAPGRGPALVRRSAQPLRSNGNVGRHMSKEILYE